MNFESGEVKKVVIAGGGTAGWLAAAALSRQLGKVLDITLVESDEIGTVGVGEATIPPMRMFHRLLRIDEQDFMRATSATFKLGIEFENWGNIGDNYIHSFGRTGKDTWLGDFHHFWLQGREKGVAADFGEYCLEWKAAREGKFGTSPQSDINYAYHLDATLYAVFLRKFCEGYGVKRIEGKIQDVVQDPDSGFITSLGLESGKIIEGDLFVDCTGFRGLLIEQSLHTGYEDWSHWLACDTAVAVQTESVGPAIPYTRSIAFDSGWRWQIPLQHRVGNGLVYCSRYISDDDARSKLLDEIDGEPLTDPRVIRFRTGRRLLEWNKNCVSLGLASGFVEPLESTSIFLIMQSASRLMSMFPFGGIHQSTVDEYNAQAREELERIRDFIVLHYHATERTDSPFWRYCRNMKVPESLAHRIDLFRKSGYILKSEADLFKIDSWTQVMMGQGIVPESHHHIARMMADNDLQRFLNSLRESVTDAVGELPAHQDFVDQYCSIDST